MSGLRLFPLQSDLSALKAKAASGHSGVAKRAQDELRRIMHQQLEREVCARRGREGANANPP